MYAKWPDRLFRWTGPVGDRLAIQGPYPHHYMPTSASCGRLSYAASRSESCRMRTESPPQGAAKSIIEAIGRVSGPALCGFWHN